MAIKVNPRAQERLAALSVDTYREAYERGMSLSGYLEVEDPSEEYKDGLDAFSRLCMVAGIRMRSIPEMGIWADTFNAFDKSPQTRALIPEFLARAWRRAATGRAVMQRDLYVTTDNVPGTIAHPYVDNLTPRYPLIAPAIPLAELIAMTTPIDNDAYRAMYLVDDTSNEREVRVAEGAEIPRAKLTSGQNTIRIRKFGRAIEMTYEQMRRMRIDMLAFHIARMAIQTEVDKVAAVIDVAINGDGNTNTAATAYNSSTFDAAATGGTLTLKAWLTFKKKFKNPYMLTAVLAQEDTTIKMETLNTGTANIPLVNIQAASGFGSLTPINPGLADNVRYGWTTDAPATAILGFDTRFGIERVFEVGADITEVQRWVERQAQAIFMTEVEGYAKFDQQAVKLMNLA